MPSVAEGLTMNALLQAFGLRKQSEAEALGQKWKEYVELLRRADTPRPGDSEKLLALADELGLSESDIALHVEVVTMYDRAVVDAQGEQQATARLAELEAARKTHLEAIGAARMALAKIDDELPGIKDSMARAMLADDRRRELLRCYPVLFGDHTTKPARPSATGWHADLLQRHGRPVPTSAMLSELEPERPAPYREQPELRGSPLLRHGVGDL